MVDRPVRRTREQQAAVTRARLVEAAGQVFAERGFHGATIEEITERAGFTRGAFYSNFAGKDELFLALVDERLEQDITQVGTALEGATGPEDVVAALWELEEAQSSDEYWAMLSAEFWLYAMRHPEVRPRLAARRGEHRRAYAQAIEDQFAQLGLELPASADLLALIVQSVDGGILREHLLDPVSVPHSSFLEALDVLFRAGVELARAQQTAR